jgi:cell division protein FtsQ
MRIDRAFLFLLVLILIMGGAYIYACQSPKFKVTQITIRGNEKIPAEEIKARIESCMNKNILGLNVKIIEERLKEDSRLKDVRIKRMLPGSLLIEVQEKRPALWINLPAGLSELGDCGFCGLSLDQEIIPLDQNDLSRDLPVITGIGTLAGNSTSYRMPKPYQKWDHVRIQKALEIFNTITDMDPGSAGLLSEINLTDLSNPVLYLSPGIKVMMGPGDFEKKWKRVQTILGEEKEIGSFSCLDLRFDHQVLLTKSSSYQLIEQTKKQAKSKDKQ